MFFILTKLFELLLQPVNFVAVLGLVGLAFRATAFVRTGSVIVAASVLILAIFCFSPLGALMLRPLEDRFPAPPENMSAPTGIIVLGGALDEDVGSARHQTTLTQAAARLTAGAALARRFPTAKLIFTGGSADLFPQGLVEADGVRDLWLSLGVPASQMIFEDKSRNTHENATMTRAIVRPKPGNTWLLVTSAAHMPRSVGIFRKDGWSVTAYPVDYRTRGDWRDWIPSRYAIEALNKLDVAFHEWLGLVAYRLTDRTNALLPAP